MYWFCARGYWLISYFTSWFISHWELLARDVTRVSLLTPRRVAGKNTWRPILWASWPCRLEHVREQVFVLEALAVPIIRGADGDATLVTRAVFTPTLTLVHCATNMRLRNKPPNIRCCELWHIYHMAQFPWCKDCLTNTRERDSLRGQGRKKLQHLNHSQTTC